MTFLNKEDVGLCMYINPNTENIIRMGSPAENPSSSMVMDLESEKLLNVVNQLLPFSMRVPFYLFYNFIRIVGDVY